LNQLTFDESLYEILLIVST